MPPSDPNVLVRPEAESEQHVELEPTDYHNLRSEQISATEAITRLLSLKHPAERCKIAHELTFGSASSEVAVTWKPDYDSASLIDHKYETAKRLFDLIVTIGLLIILLPLFVIVSLAIVIDSGFPVLYFQPRVGRNGKPFRFYKFRSMVKNADALKAKLADKNEATGGIFKIRDDPRVTKVGKFLRKTSIDELPQLINVLQGDISLIGPRPMVVPEANMCDSRQYMRHSVKPGLFCLREISGRSALSFSEWMELDLVYVYSRTLLIDIKILLNIIPAVLEAHGAY